MAIVLFDTNILIDHMLGIRQATIELGSYEDAAISAISWMEVACKLTPLQIAVFDAGLADAGIVVIQTTPFIMRGAARLRGRTAKKLPDCIILATAQAQERVVVTRDAIDFGAASGAQVRIPYRLVDGVITDVQPVPA
ncbi:MAG: VapC toxin family domain ribonuclease [Massilia sp.]|jgi:predicted nucleic acid-binding protein|nr:VapC toxin family domain ribonuclease [Massilia sp.]